MLIPWAILLAPLVSAVVIMAFCLRRPRLASTISVAGILISLSGSILLFLFHGAPAILSTMVNASWIHVSGLHVDFGFLVDRLSILMLLVVTGVASCIFFYSVGYMKGDESFPRYFASLSFFAFSMIGVVLANNFLMLFVFWELVAVSSYLLIGFWFEKPAAADAGNKAFIVNRLADFGLILGIFYIWMLSGAGGAERSFNFAQLSRSLPASASQGALTLAALLVFCGVAGKSAQFPLYIWLPDAMEGPTPVSALIHAATMVAAGVYLLCRTFFLVGGSVQALEVMAVFGAVTAFLAALLAVTQNDIKKILAYSTVSQLGYMVMAVGLGGPTPAMFHLTTHAFFKALLFLGAGAMIHALHTQDIWEMGGLLKRMPVTAVTFLVGTLALCGIWPLSGFFSKDEILALAYEHNRFIYAAALFTAGLTAFYMSRACWIAVLGPVRSSKHAQSQETPLVMRAPLVILALFSALGGFLGISGFLRGEHGHAEALNLAVALTSSAVALAGLALGSLVYARLRSHKDPLKDLLGRFYEFVRSKYYLDELFLALANFFQRAVAGVLFWFDWNVLVQRGVNGAASLTAQCGSLLRRAQTGRVGNYARVFAFGVVALVYFVIVKG